MTEEGVYSSETEGRITHGLLRLSTAMRSQAWKWAEKAGLTPTQGEILVLLMQRKGPLRLGDIARQTALTAATTSDAVTTLETKGLIEKRRALDDGRALAVKLTAKGRTAAKRAAQWPDFLQAAAGGLPVEERGALYRSLLKMIHDLEAKEQIPRHRTCLSCKHFGSSATNSGGAARKTTRRVQSTTAPLYHCGLLGFSMSDTGIRLDCPVYEEADESAKRANWKIFLKQR